MPAHRILPQRWCATDILFDALFLHNQQTVQEMCNTSGGKWFML
jgi:hypothetical protein